MRHRAREILAGARTRMLNALRGNLAEIGVVAVVFAVAPALNVVNLRLLRSVRPGANAIVGAILGITGTPYQLHDCRLLRAAPSPSCAAVPKLREKAPKRLKTRDRRTELSRLGQ
jgi:hypothetical protein